MSKKDRAQIHDDYNVTVFSPDTSKCPPFGMYLSKYNGLRWQKRWFYLNNENLIYRDKPTTDIKGVLDLKDFRDAVQKDSVVTVSFSYANYHFDFLLHLVTNFRF